MRTGGKFAGLQYCLFHEVIAWEWSRKFVMQDGASAACKMRKAKNC